MRYFNILLQSLYDGYTIRVLTMDAIFTFLFRSTSNLICSRSSKECRKWNSMLLKLLTPLNFYQHKNIPLETVLTHIKQLLT